MLRTDRTSGHYHLDDMVNYFCHMSSVRGTSDGRGPVTRTRVPDRDEQGKPSEDARRGRCHPLEAGIYPCGCHRYRDTQLPSTKYQGGRENDEGLWEIPLFPSTLALEECRPEGILGRVLQSWVPFVNYKLAQLFVFDKYKPHFVFHKLVPISSLVWS